MKHSVEKSRNYEQIEDINKQIQKAKQNYDLEANEPQYGESPEASAKAGG